MSEIQVPIMAPLNRDVTIENRKFNICTMAAIPADAVSTTKKARPNATSWTNQVAHRSRGKFDTGWALD
jgi:hypothetical protein